KNLLGGQSLRHADSGGDKGGCLIDVGNDGFFDVGLGKREGWETRPGAAKKRAGEISKFSVGKYNGPAMLDFGVISPNGQPTLMGWGAHSPPGWVHFKVDRWALDNSLSAMIAPDNVNPDPRGGVRLRDLDKDGRCEWIVGRTLFSWSPKKKAWDL